MSRKAIQVAQPRQRAQSAAIAHRDWRGVFVVPFLVFVVLATTSIMMAVNWRAHQIDSVRLEVESTANELTNSLQNQLKDVEDELERLRDHLYVPAEKLEAEFSSQAHALTARDPGIQQLIWADAQGVTRFAIPPLNSAAARDLHDVANEGRWRDAWTEAREEGVDTLSGYRMQPSDTQFRCLLPVFDTTPPGKSSGAVLARISIDHRVRYLLARLQHEYHFQLSAGDLLLYSLTADESKPATSHPAELIALSEAYERNGGSGAPMNCTADGLPADPTGKLNAAQFRRWQALGGAFATSRTIHIFDRTWRLQIAPTNSLIDRYVHDSPASVGIGGVLISLILSGGLFQLMYSRSLHDSRRREYLLALERLNQIATAICARIGAPREVLDQLAIAAHDLLRVDRSGIALLSPDGQSVRVVAGAGDMPKNAASEFQLSELPMCREVLRSRKPLFVGDVQGPHGDLNTDIAALFNARSLMLLPLVTSEHQLGIMAVSSSKVRQFTDEQKRLAELLASKAAVILSNSELYSRMGDAMRTQQVLFEQREAIFAVNAAVYQAGTLNESLQMIAELAPGVLGVDLCVVSLNGDTEDRMRVAAITKPSGATLIGKSFTRRGTNGDVVRATRRTLVVEDAHGHPGVHPTFQAQLDVGSVAYLPLLRTGGAFMGVLVLIRHTAGPFSPELLNLAELFTVRAAAAIENAELLEQTRRDANAKSMLLRELNHRVKNNLASIITLLSLDEPEMSDRARQWLRRAIDRIRTMARTHDLFSGGIERVPLVDLVQQTIPSLSVVRPPSVIIRSDVQAEVTLRTDRAVSLAMVLHELCYNAIVHGLGSAAGSVLIRARMQGRQGGLDGKTRFANGVLLEVVDDATASREMDENRRIGLPANSGPAENAAQAIIARPTHLDARPERVGSGGLGLVLVDGLVTRELNGEFSLLHTDEGTVAQVWFPVAPEDRIT